mgnify:CR=1 FL=1
MERLAYLDTNLATATNLCTKREHTLRNRRQGEARAVDLSARSIDPVALVVAPPLQTDS